MNSPSVTKSREDIVILKLQKMLVCDSKGYAEELSKVSKRNEESGRSCTMAEGTTKMTATIDKITEDDRHRSNTDQIFKHFSDDLI